MLTQYVSVWAQGSSSILKRHLIGQHFRRHEAGSKWLHRLTETQERLVGPKHHWTIASFCILPFALKGLQKTPSESRSGPAKCARLPNGRFCTTCTKTTRERWQEKESVTHRAWYNNCLLEEMSLWRWRCLHLLLMEQFKCTLGQTFA